MAIGRLKVVKNISFVAFLVMAMLALNSAISDGKQEALIMVLCALVCMGGCNLVTFKLQEREADESTN